MGGTAMTSRRLVLTVVLLLAWTGTAAAECAWVLWIQQTEKNSLFWLI